MKMRSTGLGKTELEGHFENIELDGDLLIMHVQTTKPVKWHLRSGIQRRDRLAVLKMLLKLNIKLIPYLWRWKSHDPPREPKDY